MSYNPYQAGPEGATAHQYTDLAKKKCLAPGSLLIASGIIAIITNLVGGLMMAGVYLGAQDELMQQMQQQQPQNFDEDVFRMVFNVYGYTGLVSAILGLIGGAIIIFGGVQMIRLRGWILAVLAAVLSIIPCFQGCCIFGIPIGIWCLVVLMDSTVKPSFDS